MRHRMAWRNSIILSGLEWALVTGGGGAFAAVPSIGYIENFSYPTLCAEMDNINIPIIASNATAYRITITNPHYNPTSINEWEADWEDCSFSSDNRLWIIGTTNGPCGEFRTDGFVPGDVFYPQDNPLAGIDEAISNFPREINNDWMDIQDIRFTADEVNDVNLEVRIGAILTVQMALVSGIVEIKVYIATTNEWIDLGNRVFNAANHVGVWNIPDHSWMEGVDANCIRLEVVHAADGGQTTSNSWAYYQYLELKRRGGLGDNMTNPAVLYRGSNTIVEAVWMDFWWRNPRQMKINVIGGSTIQTSQFMRIKRRLPDSTDWREVFVLYEDGHARIVPLPPTNLYSVPYGASIILGPSRNSSRPFAGIDEVTIDPERLTMDIAYESGGAANVQLRVNRDAHLVDVRNITYDTTHSALTRFRSMWVSDGKADIDRAQNADGVFPIMGNWSRLNGRWWAFFKQVPSYHNTYCPDFHVELLGADQGYLAREAESLSTGKNYAVTSGRTNAYNEQTLFMAASGGEAVYNIHLTQDEPATSARVRFSDPDGGNGVDRLGNTIQVIVDGLRTGETYSVATDNWNDFRLSPSIYLGDLSAGDHQIQIRTGAGTSGIELDWFELVSQPVAAAARKSVLTRQAEAFSGGTNLSLMPRSNAVSNRTVYLECTGEVWAAAVYTNIVIPTAMPNAWLRVRYVDECAPNQIRVYVDGQLRARFPSEDSDDWNIFTNMSCLYLGPLSSGRHIITFTASNETWGVELDEFEIFGVNHAPQIVLDSLYTVPIGAETNFAVAVWDGDGDPVVLTNPESPEGAQFIDNTFSWVAPVGAGGTTNVLFFVANDQQGFANSIVTNRADLAVPLDWNGDGIADEWLWINFGSLTNSPTDDNDGDGFNNYDEFIAGTQPTNSLSFFYQRLQSSLVSTPNRRLIVVPTAPGRKYKIYFTDQAPSNDVVWSPFANEANGIGTWIETNTEPTTHIFQDDESGDTTGGPSTSGRRFYRVEVELLP
jgi:hypothetical protein